MNTNKNMKTNCNNFWFPKHQWNKWEEDRQGNFLRQGTDFVIGRYIDQKRVCENCRKIEIRREEISI